MKFEGRRFMIYFALLLMGGAALHGCSSGSSTDTGLNGAGTINGNVVDANGNAVAGATVFIPGQAINNVSLVKNISASCEGHGGSINCEEPSEANCASTCSCGDGSYSLNASSCSSGSNQITFCINGECQVADINCDGGGVCTINLVQDSPNTGGDTASCDSTSQITDAVCGRLLDCAAVPLSECQSIFPTQEGMWDEFGLSAPGVDQSKLFSEICDGLENGSVGLNQGNLPNCLATINSTGCNEVGESDALAYSNIENWVGVGCGGQNSSQGVFFQK